MSLFGQSQQQNNAGSLFGSTAQQQQKPPSLFLQPTTATPSSQPASGSLFGSTLTSQPQPQQSGGLFGSTATSTSQPQQSSSLFGQTAAAPQTQQTTSLFGSNAATTSQPQQSGGLFGSLSTQPQQQSTPSLFGSTATTSSQPQQSSSLFGSAPQPQQQNATSLFGAPLGQQQSQLQPSGSGLLGASTNTTNTLNKPALSLFPNNTQTQQQAQPSQQPSLFASSTNPVGGSLTSPHLSTSQRLPGTLTMGQSTSQPQTVPGVRIDVSNLRGTTRFNDLHEDLQKQIEMIDAFIQQQISFKEQCDALMPAHEQNLSTVPSDVDFVKAKLEMAELTLANDSNAIDSMKTVTQQDIEDAKIGFRAVENLKLPQQFHYTGIWRPTASTMSPPRGSASASRTSDQSSSAEATDLVGYFNKQTQDLTKLLEMYSQNIGEIETHLGTVEASAVAQSQQLMFRQGRDGGSRSKQEQVTELAAVLRQFESGILGVAAKVGQAREGVVEIIEKGPGGALVYRR